MVTLSGLEIEMKRKSKRPKKKINFCSSTMFEYRIRNEKRGEMFGGVEVL